MADIRCPGQNMMFWKPEDVFEVNCPHCGNPTEFFKDEQFLLCRKCGKEVRNPRIDLGCAKWCKFAEDCIGVMPQSQDALGSTCERLISEMKAVFGDDQRRIDHALKVLTFAERILATEEADALTVKAAAILHDIGIPAAEQKYGSAAGNYQETEGPPIAREIMERLQLPDDVVEHVCRIVATHHTIQGRKTLEFRILWDADWLVNIPDEYPDAPKSRISPIVAKVFRTKHGREIAVDELLGLTPSQAMRWGCNRCSYAYDPLRGDETQGIPALTWFDKLPATWRCPWCGVPAQLFTSDADWHKAYDPLPPPKSSKILTPPGTHNL